MASAAQVLANQANAQHSTGPKSEAGKARASRNNLKHGLTLGVLTLSPEEQTQFCEFEAKMRAECNPEAPWNAKPSSSSSTVPPESTKFAASSPP